MRIYFAFTLTFLPKPLLCQRRGLLLFMGGMMRAFLF
jgi:hypothetical protein